MQDIQDITVSAFEVDEEMYKRNYLLLLSLLLIIAYSKGTERIEQLRQGFNDFNMMLFVIKKD